MKSKLWTAALLLATAGGVSLGTETARANAAEDEVVATKKQEVWEMQIRYCSLTLTGVFILGGAYWLLNKTNQSKKVHFEALRKQEQFQLDEDLPLD